MNFDDLAHAMNAELLDGFGVYATGAGHKILGVFENGPSEPFDITTNEPVFIVRNTDAALWPVGTEITINSTVYKIRAKHTQEDHLTNLILSKS